MTLIMPVEAAILIFNDFLEVHPLEKRLVVHEKKYMHNQVQQFLHFI